MTTASDSDNGPTGAPVIPVSACTGIVWPAIPSHGNGVILSLMHQLEKSEWYPLDRLEELQLRQLTDLFKHAAKTVPFYRDRLNVLSDSGKNLTMKTWRMIPVLSRVELQNAAEEILSRSYPKSHGRVGDVWTSGSTGRPVKVKSTMVTGLFFSALHLRYHLWHRRDFQGKVASIHLASEAKIEASRKGEKIPWVPAYGTGEMVYESIRKPVGEQLVWLGKVQPDYLITYPSNLQALIERSHEQGKRPDTLRQVCTMGEVLNPSLREQCRTDWGVGISDVYSAQEVGMIAIQCPEHDHYHVQSESVFVEVLDDDGQSCMPGETGRIVVTDLHNAATPLIRYEIGDYAEVGPPCPCGRGLPVLAQIRGRVRNMLRLPTGDVVWPLFFSAEIGEVVPEVCQAQLVQTGLEDLTLRVVVDRPLDQTGEDRLRRAVLKRLGHSFALTVETVDRIARSANGKYEDFMSALPGA